MTTTSGTTNYMSNATILAWMEAKTEGIYGQMRDAMDTSNDRADAEKAMNKIKADLSDAAANGTDAVELKAELDAAIKKYGTEFPEVKDALQPIADEIDKDAAANLAKAQSATTYSTYNNGSHNVYARVPVAPATVVPAPVVLDKETADRMGKNIDGQLDALGKADQLGMVNIQEYNSQLNQAKNTASALMDSSDKASQNIISHIS